MTITTDNSGTEVRLANCPFCGGKAKQNTCLGAELVRCASGVKPHCPASFGGVSVEAWNRRPAQPVERVSEGVSGLRVLELREWFNYGGLMKREEWESICDELLARRGTK